MLDFSLEAGLIKEWIESYERKVREIYIKRGFKRFEREEVKDTLDLSQILPICVILLIGHGIALLTFLLEIFYHDFVRQLGYFWKKWKKLIRKRKKLKLKKLKTNQNLQQKNMKKISK